MSEWPTAENHPAAEAAAAPPSTRARRLGREVARVLAAAMVAVAFLLELGADPALVAAVGRLCVSSSNTLPPIP